MKKLLLSLVAAVLIAPASAQAVSQGESHVRLSQYAPGLAGELTGPRNAQPFVYSTGVDPNAMWLDRGFWGGTVWVRYSPWWNPKRDFAAMAYWNCVDFVSWVYCERHD